MNNQTESEFVSLNIPENLPPSASADNQLNFLPTNYDLEDSTTNVNQSNPVNFNMTFTGNFN